MPLPMEINGHESAGTLELSREEEVIVKICQTLHESRLGWKLEYIELLTNLRSELSETLADEYGDDWETHADRYDDIYTLTTKEIDRLKGPPEKTPRKTPRNKGVRNAIAANGMVTKLGRR